MAKPNAASEPSSSMVTQSLEMIAKAVRDVKDGQAVISDSVTKIATRVDALESRVDKAPITLEQEVEGVENVKSRDEKDGILEAVKELLGERFIHEVRPHQPGMTFELIIRPPVEIAEFEGAFNSSVIAYADGLEEVKIFLRKVRDFYIGLTAKRGQSYELYARGR